MKIALIGSGNVAHHLAKAFAEKQFTDVQLFGRNENALKQISEQTNFPFSTKTFPDADLYLIAVSDRAIGEVSRLVAKKDCLVAHASGATPKTALQGAYRKAVFYPLQTFSKNSELGYGEIPFFIDADCEQDRNLLTEIGEKISGKVFFANDETRKYIHLTAVFACNFVNHLFARAKEISDEKNIPFEYFLPLINETVKKIHQTNPKSAQTGPAVRNDQAVLETHRKLLYGDKLKIYDVVNQSIKNMYGI